MFWKIVERMQIFNLKFLDYFNIYIGKRCKHALCLLCFCQTRVKSGL